MTKGRIQWSEAAVYKFLSRKALRNSDNLRSPSPTTRRAARIVWELVEMMQERKRNKPGQ